MAKFLGSFKIYHRRAFEFIKTRRSGSDFRNFNTASKILYGLKYKVIKINVKKFRNEEGITVLHYACKHNFIDVVKILLNKKVEINSIDN